MTSVTTIKVPRELRDRLAEHARREHISLATVIERAVTGAEEQAFWSAVREDHAELTDADRAAYVGSPSDHDDLADDADASLSESDGW
jgi:predicted transcriptional regulator